MSAIIKVAFLFGMFGQDFTTGRALLAIVVAVFSSVAMSGIPGGGGTGELSALLDLLPGSFGGRIPDRAGARQSGRSARNDGTTPPATTVVSSSSPASSTARNWLQKQLQKQKANK